MKKTPDTTTAVPSAPNSANSTQLVLTSARSAPRVDSRLLAQQLGSKHRSVFALIDRYSERLRGHGQLLFKKAVGERAQGGGNAERFALLNENQAILLLALSRNTERVVELKDRLVREFASARRAAELRQTDYLPGYHALHDAIKVHAHGSTNARWHHINANNALNALAGLQPGQRGTAGPGALSVLTVGACLATLALQRDASTSACSTVQDRIKQALAPLQGVPGLLRAPGVPHG